jgi:hypothetical protein
MKACRPNSYNHREPYCSGVAQVKSQQKRAAGGLPAIGYSQLDAHSFLVHFDLLTRFIETIASNNFSPPNADTTGVP